MKISIIIPTKDRPSVFDSTINQAIKAIEGIDAEIIVVNDSKTSIVQIPESSPNVRLLNNPKSGVASARNLGANTAKGELLLFLDDDILINQENILEMLNVHLKYPTAAINFLRIYPPFLLEQIRHTSFGRFLIKYGFTSMKEGLDSQWKNADIFEPEVVAAFLFMHINTFWGVGGYNDQFPFGSEDYEFSMRLGKNNIKKIAFTKYVVLHNEIDRIQIKNWLRRRQVGAEGRARGSNLGSSELLLHISTFKRSFYFLLSLVKPALIIIQRNMPNSPKWDLVNHRFIHLLLGTAIFIGFQKGRRDGRKKT